MSQQQIIEWSIDGIRLLVADSSGRVTRAALWNSFQHHDTDITAEELGEELRKWLDQQGVATGPATLVLPREMVVIRQLQLPQAPPEEIPDLVKFQSAAKSSVPVDDLALDYLPVPSSGDVPGLSVLTASIDRKRLRRIIQSLHFAGFEITRVTATSVSIAPFAKTYGGATLGVSEPEIIVFQRGSLIEMSIFDRGSLLFAHTLVLPEGESSKALESGLTRSIVALKQSQPGVDFSRCYLCGTRSDNSVQKLLEKRFGDGLVEVAFPAALAAGSDVAGFECLIGAVLSDANANLHLDFLHPRKRIEKPDRTKWYWIGGSVAAALIMMVGYGLFVSKKSGLDASIASLNESIAETDKKLKEGEPQADAFSKIQSWSQGQTNPIEVWNYLRNHMPGTDRLYLSELRLQPVTGPDVEARLTGVGFARQRNDVDNLYQQLAENGFRVMPQATSTTSRDPDYPVRFELNVEILRGNLVPPDTAQSSTDHDEDLETT